MPGNVETRSPQLPVIKNGFNTTEITAALSYAAAKTPSRPSDQAIQTPAEVADALNTYKDLSPEEKTVIKKKIFPFQKIVMQINQSNIPELDHDLKETKSKLDGIDRVLRNKDPNSDHPTKLKIKELEAQTEQARKTAVKLNETLTAVTSSSKEIAKDNLQKRSESLNSPLNHVPSSIVEGLKTRVFEQIRDPLAEATKDMNKLSDRLDNQLKVMMAVEGLEKGAADKLRQSASPLDAPNPSDS